MEYWLVVLGAAVVILLFILSSRAKRERLAREREVRQNMLLAKYGDTQIVNDILNGSIRQGMTMDMVLEAWGKPAAIDHKVYRTKTKDVLKYGPGPRRSFASRVTVEDGIVVGWEQR